MPKAYTDKALKPEALRLHFEEGQGQSAIARKLSLPIGTVGVWLHAERKARQKASEYQDRANRDGQGAEPEELETLKQNSVEDGDTEETERAKGDERLRAQALKVLTRAMRSKNPPQAHQVEAANKILGRLAKPKQDTNADAWQSQYEGMKDTEIAERIVTCAANLLGIDVLQATLDRLKAQGQASLV